MDYRIRLAVTAICLACISAPAHANKVKKLNLSGKSGYSEAPEIEVYSTSGEKWTNVDKTDTSKFTANLGAECQFEGKGNKAYQGSFYVPGFDIVGDDSPSNHLIPHTKTASGVFRWNSGQGQTVDPVKVCNDELAKRQANNPNKSKYEFLADGFNVNYPSAFVVKYQLTCKPTGAGFTDIANKTAKVNAKIACKGSPKAAQNIPKPAPPQPKRAKLVPLIKTASFKANPANYSGKCPTNVKFDGTITANRAGEVTYQYTSHDGKKSPKFTLEFDKAGAKKTRAWSTTVSEPDTTGSFQATGGGSGSNAIQGWYRLDVLTPTPGKIMAKYTVNCGVQASPGTIKIAPAQQPARQPTRVQRTQ